MSRLVTILVLLFWFKMRKRGNPNQRKLYLSETTGDTAAESTESALQFVGHHPDVAARLGDDAHLLLYFGPLLFGVRYVLLSVCLMSVFDVG